VGESFYQRLSIGLTHDIEISYNNRTGQRLTDSESDVGDFANLNPKSGTQLAHSQLE
jgi:hypothetical protein